MGQSGPRFTTGLAPPEGASEHRVGDADRSETRAGCNTGAVDHPAVPSCRDSKPVDVIGKPHRTQHHTGDPLSGAGGGAEQCMSLLYSLFFLEREKNRKYRNPESCTGFEKSS